MIRASSLLKILLGMLLVGVIVKTQPLWDILNLFTFVVLVPVALLVGLGLISQGTYQGLKDFTSGWLDTLRLKFQQNLEDLRKDFKDYRNWDYNRKDPEHVVEANT